MFIVLEECSYGRKAWIGEVIKEGSFLSGPFQNIETAQEALRIRKQKMLNNREAPYIEYEDSRLSCDVDDRVILYSDFSICKLERVQCPETN